MTKWVIDERQVVHWNVCGEKQGKATPYVTVPKTESEMAAWLARPDQSGGMITHRGPSALTACPTCILSES